MYTYVEFHAPIVWVAWCGNGDSFQRSFVLVLYIKEESFDCFPSETFSQKAIILRSNQALGEKGVTLFFENRKNKKSTSRYLKIMKNGGFLFKIGRKLRPAALMTYIHTDIFHPHRNPQSQEIPYAALLSVYDDNKEKKYNTR